MLLVEVILRLLDQVHLLQIILYIVEFGFTIMHQGLVEDSLGTIQALSSSTNDPHGWDDWQDGTGMGDNWSVEGESSNYARGLPSYIVIG